MDSDCASKLACFDGNCRNPCYEIKPCGPNAECTVVDTLPHRTMSCQCIPGYVGDADIQCKLGNGNLFWYKTKFTSLTISLFTYTCIMVTAEKFELKVDKIINKH